MILGEREALTPTNGQIMKELPESTHSYMEAIKKKQCDSVTAIFKDCSYFYKLLYGTFSKVLLFVKLQEISSNITFMRSRLKKIGTLDIFVWITYTMSLARQNLKRMRVRLIFSCGDAWIKHRALMTMSFSLNFPSSNHICSSKFEPSLLCRMVVHNSCVLFSLSPFVKICKVLRRNHSHYILRSQRTW